MNGHTDSRRMKAMGVWTGSWDTARPLVLRTEEIHRRSRLQSLVLHQGEFLNVSQGHHRYKKYFPKGTPGEGCL